MGFPEELKKLNRWVGYRLVPDKDGGKPKKVPINAVTGQNAKSNDPATWCDYQTAKEALAHIREIMKVAILYTVGYLFEHREKADYTELTLTLRSLLFSIREGVV